MKTTKYALPALGLGVIALAIAGVSAVFGNEKALMTSIAFSNLGIAMFVLGYVLERRGRWG